MTFTTPIYVLFFAAVFCLHLVLPQRYRWIVLLTASAVFYAALRVPHLLAALAWVVTVTYLCGRWISAGRSERQKQGIFWAGVGLNLLALLLLKYIPFLTDNLNALLGALNVQAQVPAAKTLVSIGVSFYVFQAISYLADIRRGVQAAERHFGIFALYISFFPRLLQGPIERAASLLPQLHQDYRFDYENVRAGLLLFAWGMFKKVVIADRLGLLVDPVYGDVQAYQGATLLLGTYLYALQIYFDFSGYTDMALGVARLFNIRLTENFHLPYLANSVPDFWRRWHISFSTWIMDYIFKPLQMGLRSWMMWGTVLALLVTFFFSGLWHGASWGFVIWGMLHGIYLAVSALLAPFWRRTYKKLKIEKSRVLKAWQVFATFQLVAFAWIFFRAGSVREALYVVTHLLRGWGGQLAELAQAARALSPGGMAVALLPGQGIGDLLIPVFGLAVAAAVVFLKPYFTSKRPFFSLPAVLRWGVYYTLLIVILALGIFSNSQFLYFQF